MEEIYNNTCA